jgi:hypothetical protein
MLAPAEVQPVSERGAIQNVAQLFEDAGIPHV